MYLHAHEVTALFRDVSEICHTLVFTFMEKTTDGSIGFRNQNPLIETWLKWRGEPFRWGIARESLPEFLEERGFRCQKIIDDETLRHEILAPLGHENIALAKGECICIANRISP